MAWCSRGYHKNIAVPYIYEITYFYDFKKNETRTHRISVGKLDPITGEIIATRRYSKLVKKSSITPKKEVDDRAGLLEAELRRLKFQIKNLSIPLHRLECNLTNLRDFYNSHEAANLGSLEFYKGIHTKIDTALECDIADLHAIYDSCVADN